MGRGSCSKSSFKSKVPHLYEYSAPFCFHRALKQILQIKLNPHIMRKNIEFKNLEKINLSVLYLHTLRKNLSYFIRIHTKPHSQTKKSWYNQRFGIKSKPGEVESQFDTKIFINLVFNKKL